MFLIWSGTRSRWCIKRFTFSYSCPQLRKRHNSNEILTFSCPRRCRQRTTSLWNLSTLESGVRGHQMVLEVQNRQLCQGFFSAIQSSEMRSEIPSGLHLEILNVFSKYLFEISPTIHTSPQSILLVWLYSCPNQEIGGFQKTGWGRICSELFLGSSRSRRVLTLTFTESFWLSQAF